MGQTVSNIDEIVALQKQPTIHRSSGPNTPQAQQRKRVLVRNLDGTFFIPDIGDIQGDSSTI